MLDNWPQFRLCKRTLFRFPGHSSTVCKTLYQRNGITDFEYHLHFWVSLLSVSAIVCIFIAFIYCGRIFPHTPAALDSSASNNLPALSLSSVFPRNYPSNCCEFFRSSLCAASKPHDRIFGPHISSAFQLCPPF